jgi:hypothetical protein
MGWINNGGHQLSVGSNPAGNATKLKRNIRCFWVDLFNTISGVANVTAHRGKVCLSLFVIALWQAETARGIWALATANHEHYSKQ